MNLFIRKKVIARWRHYLSPSSEIENGTTPIQETNNTEEQTNVMASSEHQTSVMASSKNSSSPPPHQNSSGDESYSLGAICDQIDDSFITCSKIKLLDLFMHHGTGFHQLPNTLTS